VEANLYRQIIQAAAVAVAAVLCTTAKAMFCIWLLAVAVESARETAHANQVEMPQHLKAQEPTSKTTTMAPAAIAILP
jgi:hypothetical protein